MTTTIRNNLNAFFELTKPLVHFMIKSTNPSSTVTSSSSTATNVAQSYSYLQAKLFLFVVTFWMVLLIINMNKNQFLVLKCYLYETLVNQVLKLKTSRLVIRLLSTLLYQIQVFEIWKINSFIQRLKSDVLSIKNFKGEFLKSFKTALFVVPKAFHSISAVAAAFSFNLKRVILFPLRIRQTFQAISYNISRFWHTIEQIIQIVRLPIEVLKFIGKFLSSCVSLLQRLEAPRRPKLI